MNKGRVYLVGAGPGDPGLITVKGLRLLRTADVIIHDRLIPRDLLMEASPDAELIDVGKDPHLRRVKQEEINQLMVERARQGNVVVRLKGGDPCVLGRGGEEITALSEAGVDFEIVPGVSSFLAAPECAGIPLTFRGVSSSFAVITGREARGKGRVFIDHKKIAEAVDTIVILMGVETLEYTVLQLLKGGMDPATPVAVVEWGATERQRVAEGELRNIVKMVREANVQSPAVVVVGETVRTRGLVKHHLRGYANE
ncbi:MAG: uroporphyrinogen-III C-methyltransferase [Candidatus Geothermarchaeales archaeon]